MSNRDEQDVTKGQLSDAELSAIVVHNIGNTLTGINAISRRYQRSIDDLQRLHDKLAMACQRDLSPQQHKAILQSCTTALHNIIQAEDNPSSLNANQSKLLTGLEHLKGSINLYHDANSQAMPSEHFNLQQSIHSCFSLIDLEGIQTQINCPTGWQVKGQQNLFLQMLVNVLKNASEAIYQRQQSDLNFQPLVQIDVFESEPGVLQIVIADNGCGISQDDKELIFAMGYTTKTYGTGIGLTSIMDIAKQFDGHIKLSSDGVNLGACLTITLPKHN